jgi:hypothetical protein
MTATPPGRHDQVVPGRPLIGDYDLALALAKQLTPDQSLSRASDSAKWAVQTIALVATFLAGFGAIAGLSTVPTRHGSLIVTTIVLAGLAVLAGIVSLLPTLRTVDINRAPSVERHFHRLLLRRGVFAIAAFLFLLAAIGVAITASVATETDPVIPTATLTSGWDGSSTAPVVSADVSVSHANPGTLISLVITGTDSAVLTRAHGSVGQNGTTEISIKFVPTKDIGPFVASATDTSVHPHATLATVTLSDPPTFIPTTTSSSSAPVPVPDPTMPGRG